MSQILGEFSLGLDSRIVAVQSAQSCFGDDFGLPRTGVGEYRLTGPIDGEADQRNEAGAKDLGCDGRLTRRVSLSCFAGQMGLFAGTVWTIATRC